jgi:uncharacterized lipoprotein
MKKTITIVSLALAAAALSGCSKSPEQNVMTENASNAADATENSADIAPNGADAIGIENASNAS